MVARGEDPLSNTKIVVFQCESEIPKVFKDDLLVHLTKESIKKFAMDFHRNVNFFPTLGQAFAKDAPDTLIEQRSQHLFDDLIKARPGAVEPPYTLPRWISFTISLDDAHANEIDQDRQRNRRATRRTTKRFRKGNGQSQGTRWETRDHRGLSTTLAQSFRYVWIPERTHQVCDPLSALEERHDQERARTVFEGRLVDWTLRSNHARDCSIQRSRNRETLQKHCRSPNVVLTSSHWKDNGAVWKEGTIWHLFNSYSSGKHTNKHRRWQAVFVMAAYNKAINSDREKHRSFLAMLFAAGYGCRTAHSWCSTNEVSSKKRFSNYQVYWFWNLAKYWLLYKWSHVICRSISRWKSIFWYWT